MTKIVEFIESYRHDEKGGDYEWNDNHGVLTRCENCRYYDANTDTCDRWGGYTHEDGYCHYAWRKE